MTINQLLWPLIGYLFGSISSAVIVSKLFGLNDPRTTGSGNPGATNVLRSGNKPAALITLLGDLFKGLVPVLLATYWVHSPSVIALVAIGAFLGHLYPIFFGFKGGKGVATAIGVFLGLNPILFLVFVVTWLITAGLTKISSLSALVASAIVFLSSFVLFTQPDEFTYIGTIFFIVAFLFKRHSANIERLKNGTEKKIGYKKK